MTLAKQIEKLTKGKVTNIKLEDYDLNNNAFIIAKNEDIVIGKDYVFEIYEGYGAKKEIPEMDLIVFYGHETIIVYNTKTKKFKEIETR